jgi:hypothetical protein
MNFSSWRIVAISCCFMIRGIRPYISSGSEGFGRPESDCIIGL